MEPESGIDHLTFHSSQCRETAVIKSVRDHPRVKNERDILKRVQSHTSFLKPLVDEIEEPHSPVIIALRYLESDLLDASISKTLIERGSSTRHDAFSRHSKHSTKMDTYTRVFPEMELSASTQPIEIKDAQLDNVFLNLQEGDMRFSDVRLGDLGGCCPNL
jgi:hypothetical protein